MNRDYFKSYILVSCEPSTAGKEYRPQLRGILNSELYLLDHNGAEGQFHDTHFDTHFAIVMAWLELHPEHRQTVAQKTWILQQLLPDYTYQEVLEKTLSILDIPQQEPVFKSYRDIGSRLSQDILTFAHEKHFSLKQCQSFALMEPHILSALLEYKDRLNLSASHFLELSELLSDYGRKTNLSAQETLKKSPLDALLANDSLNQNQRTDQLKRELKLLRLPVLSELNHTMTSLVASMDLPSHMTLDWDKTLENPGLDLNVKINSKDDLKSVAAYIQQHPTLSGMSDMLELQ